MQVNDNSANEPVINAATLALKTGNVNDILAWIPKYSQNKVKNLFEKTLCEQRLGKDVQGTAVEWYFRMVKKLHYSGNRAIPD